MIKNKSLLYKWGVTLSSLGGLLVIMSMSGIENTFWDGAATISGAIFALLGLYMIVKGQEKEN